MFLRSPYHAFPNKSESFATFSKRQKIDVFLLANRLARAMLQRKHARERREAGIIWQEMAQISRRWRAKQKPSTCTEPLASEKPAGKAAPLANLAEGIVLRLSQLGVDLVVPPVSSCGRPTNQNKNK